MCGGRSCLVTSISWGASQVDRMGSPYFLSFRCALQTSEGCILTSVCRQGQWEVVPPRDSSRRAQKGLDREGLYPGSMFQLLNWKRGNSYKYMWIGATHLYTHTHLYNAHFHTRRTHTHSHTHMHIYLHTCALSHMHTHMHTLTHMHSHACTHTLARMYSLHVCMHSVQSLTEMQ